MKSCRERFHTNKYDNVHNPYGLIKTKKHSVLWWTIEQCWPSLPTLQWQYSVWPTTGRGGGIHFNSDRLFSRFTYLSMFILNLIVELSRAQSPPSSWLDRGDVTFPSAKLDSLSFLLQIISEQSQPKISKYHNKLINDSFLIATICHLHDLPRYSPKDGLAGT